MPVAFDLKYRPRKFSDVLGNKSVVQLLLKLSRKRELSDRSLMFGGPRGCGKTSLARIVACSVVCDNLTEGEPCGECDSCLGVRQESSDSFEEFDAATQGSVDHMRGIVSDLEYGNLNGKPSLFIMDEAQRLTKQAQDAMLKNVEDRRLFVILSTTEPHKIQGPLRGRLTEFSITPPSPEELFQFLSRVCTQEQISSDAESLRLIIQAQENCPRTCLTSLQLLSSTSIFVTVDAVKAHFRFGALEKLIKALENLATDPRQALMQIGELLDEEGPSWMRDNVVLIITSAVRVSVGAKPTVAVPASLYTTRGPAWLSVARSLSLLDKPVAADIEAILMDAIPNLPAAPAPVMVLPSAPLPSPVVSPPAEPPTPSPPPAVSTKPPEPQTKPVAPKPVVKPTSSARTLKIDEIEFSSDERLTSVDHKIEKGTRGPPSGPNHSEAPRVQYDQDKEPLSGKDFARGLVQRFKGAEQGD